MITTFRDGPIIPEPASLTVLALGGLGVLARRRRSA
ncbi:MAG: PEP-CTERM sorting domain-containing protein [Planctomycetota bacterium]